MTPALRRVGVLTVLHSNPESRSESTEAHAERLELIWLEARKRVRKRSVP